MNTLGEYKKAISRYLALGQDMEQVEVLEEYPVLRRPIPQQKRAISVGFESLEAKATGLDDYLGDGETGWVAGKEVELILRLELAVPKAQGGGGCHQLFELICQRLLLEKNEFAIHRLWCDAITLDREGGAYRLIVRAKVNTRLTQEAPAQAFTDFEMRRITA